MGWAEGLSVTGRRCLRANCGPRIASANLPLLRVLLCRSRMPDMNRFSIITITAAIFFACTGPARSESIDDVVARARKLNEAGEPSEATAVLARAFSQQREKALLEEWLAIDEKRLADLESKIIHKQMPPMPALESNDTVSTFVMAGTKAAATLANETA